MEIVLVFSINFSSCCHIRNLFDVFLGLIDQVVIIRTQIDLYAVNDQAVYLECQQQTKKGYYRLITLGKQLNSAKKSLNCCVNTE